MKELEHHIRLLIDKEEIRELLSGHARALDRHDSDNLREAYHQDSWENHGAFKGPARDFASKSGEEHASFCKSHLHHLSNHTIDLEGDIAHVETYFLAGLMRKDGMTEMVGGRYVDRLERRDGRWAIAERACIVEWNGELGATSSPFDKESFLQGRWDDQDVSHRRPLRLNETP